MATVTQKPLGRVISILSKNKIISVRNKQKKNSEIKFIKNNFCFEVINKTEKSIKNKPITFFIAGDAKEKQIIGINLKDTKTKLKNLNINIPYKKKQSIVMSPFMTSVKLSNELVASETTTNQKPMSFIVDDVRSFGNNSNNNSGNVQRIELTMQQQSFYEINIKYTFGDIVECRNLPSGLIFEKGKIKGTPMYSGMYVVEAVLNNEEINNIIINVSQLPRTL